MALITDMGVPGGIASGLDAMQQPLHKNRWRIQMNLNQGGSSIKTITSMAITAERPKVEYEEIQLHRYNSRAYLQGKYTFQPITVVIEPDLGGSCHKGIQRQMEVQQKLIGPNAGPWLGQAVAGFDYKFSMVMELLDGDYNGTNVMESWKLQGCALNNLDFGDLDYQASETIKTTMTVRYDHAFMIVSGTSKSAIGGV